MTSILGETVRHHRLGSSQLLLLLVVGHRVSGASGVCHQGDLVGPVGLLGHRQALEKALTGGRHRSRPGAAPPRWP